MAEYICPKCKNPIYDDEALLCHFCGESLQKSSKGALSKLRYSKTKIFWIVLVISIIISFLFLLFR